ncbi:hypothetical protein DQ04_12541010 [Trypanosoma grayi]|uniref:hypothetical protein n=1 Tax=Trypanosoma grayi TaxID=71804 RepID=UPI0004F491EF|nr:hypothetical protein DQ04_12541010 [Trypanosoma grayi]KEG06728.1 hypothetical protein DQ04_12541010 [Trypanosoma grayi]
MSMVLGAARPRRYGRLGLCCVHSKPPPCVAGGTEHSLRRHKSVSHSCTSTRGHMKAAVSGARAYRSAPPVGSLQRCARWLIHRLQAEGWWEGERDDRQMNVAKVPRVLVFFPSAWLTSLIGQHNDCRRYSRTPQGRLESNLTSLSIQRAFLLCWTKAITTAP